MEPFLDTVVLKEIFRKDTRVGNHQEYVDRIRLLHHQYLEAKLLPNTSEKSFSLQELARFAEDAEFLANEYTNPLVIDRIEGLPAGDIPSSMIVQDALAVAGIIFEFLGDAVSVQEELFPNRPSSHLLREEEEEEDVPQGIREVYAQVGHPDFLYLKAALCYGLGLYEPRTGVIFRNLIDHLPSPGQPLTFENAEQWSDHLICALLSRDLNQAMKAMPFVKGQIQLLRQQLRHLLVSGNTFGSFERMSLLKVAGIQTFFLLIEACLSLSEAFLRGNSELFEQAQRHFEAALRSVQRVYNYQLEWIIRVLQTVTKRMWADSPWVRLGNIIPRRRYLRKLVEEGVVTFWSSQIAAFEMTSKLGPLECGYLDDQIKRVVIHMPTSAGKTLLAQLAVAYQVFSGHGKKCVYVSPSRALCDQVAANLARHLSPFGVRVTALASDNELLGEAYESILFQQSTVIALTPEKLSHLFRQESPLVQEATLFIFDELHNIGKDGRGWTYEELISLLIRYPATADAKMLFLSAVMPNHLMIQEWVDPERAGETIDTSWQPTRTLKGVVKFPLEQLPIVHTAEREVNLSGDLVYVRRKEDLNSPLQIKGFIRSKQVLALTSPKPDSKKPSWKNRPRWKRVSGKSENDIAHAAKAAIRFASMGPVLVYCPRQVNTATLCEHLVRFLDAPFPRLNVGDEKEYDETVEFIKERLSGGHPLVKALEHRVAFHHGDLPRDVRNEIEFAFQKKWIRIMASTTTLAEGVNFPIKTLLLAHYGIPGEGNDKQWGVQHPLSKSDYKNIVGRAGRALYETEGQIVFMQSIIGYPSLLDRGFDEYLNLDPDSSELSIKSTLADEHIHEVLSGLIDAVDNRTLTEEQILFEARAVENDEDRRIVSIIDKLQTFTLLLLERNLVGEDVESFVQIFQGTFFGRQRPDIASQILGPFSQRTAHAIRSQLNQSERSLFAQTGLKISTCRKLVEHVQEYWKQYQDNISTFLSKSLDGDILYDIATIIYGLEDPEIDPQAVKISDEFSFHHERFFSDWIVYDDHEWVYDRHFSLIKNIAHRAQIYTSYIRGTLEYRASWALGAFWLFSKAYIESQHNLSLAETALGSDLLLLPAYAKFGVNSPAAALFSTLGISPARLARQLASFYESQYTQPEDRSNYPQILQWFLNVQRVDMENANFKYSYIRRVLRLLEVIHSSDNEDALPGEGRLWEKSFWIAGWGYHEGERAIQNLHKGTQLILKRNRESPVNPENAIKVVTEDDVMLGHVPDKLAKDAAKWVDRGGVKAMVSRVYPTAKPENKVYIHCWAEEVEEI